MEKKNPELIELSVTGMGCVKCENTIEAVLAMALSPVTIITSLLMMKRFDPKI